MNDTSLALRNMCGSLRRGKGFVLFVSLGIAIAMFLTVITSHSKTFGDENALQDSALRAIELNSMSGYGQVAALTSENLEDIASWPSVASVTPMPKAGFTLAGGGSVLWLVPRLGFSQPPITESIRENLLPLAVDEVILPDRVGAFDYTSWLGKTVEMQYTIATGPEQGEPGTREVTIVGIFDGGYGSLDGPGTAYGHVDTTTELAAAKAGATPEAMRDQIGFDKAIVETRTADDVLDVQRRLTEAGYGATSVQAQVNRLPAIFETLQVLGWIIVGILGLYCLGSGLSIGANLVRQRWHEIGLLKAIGFTRRRVGKIFAIELAGFGVVAGLVGVIVGLAAGAGAGLAVSGGEVLGAPMHEGVPTPPALESLFLLLLPVVALLLGGSWPIRKAASLPPDSALRQL